MKKPKAKKHKHHKKQKSKKRRRASSSDSSDEDMVRFLCGFRRSLCGLPAAAICQQSRAMLCLLCTKTFTSLDAVQKHKHQKARKRRHASVSSSSSDDRVSSALLCVLCGHTLLCMGMNGHPLHKLRQILRSAEAQAPQGQETAAGTSLEQQQRRAEGQGVRPSVELCHQRGASLMFF